MNDYILIFWPNTAWFDKRPRISMPHTLLILSRILRDHGLNVGLLDANIHGYSQEDCASIIDYCTIKSEHGLGQRSFSGVLGALSCSHGYRKACKF